MKKGSLLTALARPIVKAKLADVGLTRPDMFVAPLRAIGVDAIRVRYLDRYPMLLDLGGASITKAVLETGSYQLTLTAFVAGHVALADRTVVNVGANIGTTILNLHSVGCRRFVAIEPVSRNFDLLTTNLRAIEADADVSTHNLGIGSAAGTARINLHPTSGGRHSFVAAFGDTFEDVTVSRLDDLDLPADAFLWIDTEGFEIEVLRSGRRFLEAHRPPICLEVSPQIAGAETAAQIDALLSPLGYTYSAPGTSVVTRLTDLPGLGDAPQMDVLALSADTRNEEP